MRHHAIATAVRVRNVEEIKAALDTDEASITVEDGVYTLSEPLIIKSSVNISAASAGGVTIRRAEVPAADNPVPPKAGSRKDFRGFVVQHLGQHDYFYVHGIKFSNFSQAIHINPRKNSPGLSIEIRHCEFRNCFHGVRSEHQEGASITGTIEHCEFHKILPNIIDKGTSVDRTFRYVAKNAAIQIESPFRGLEIRNNTFDDINSVAIQLGDFKTQRIDFDGSQIASNTITNVWLNNTRDPDTHKLKGGEECHGIFVWGVNSEIYNNVLTDIVSSVKGSGNEGIYCKVRQSLHIHDNTLIDAGGRQGMITVKGGDATETADNPPADTVVENNYLWKERFENGKGFPGDANATRYYNNRVNGITIESDHVTVRNNHLYNKKTHEAGGLRILVSAGGDILLEQNKSKGATKGPNLNFGIEIYLGRLFGSQIFIRDNQIDGIRGKKAGSSGLHPAVGIKLMLPKPIDEWPKLSSPVTDVLIQGNMISNLNQSGGDEQFGVYVELMEGAGALFSAEALKELKDSVINEKYQNSFDSSVQFGGHIDNRFVTSHNPLPTVDGVTPS